MFLEGFSWSDYIAGVWPGFLGMVVSATAVCTAVALLAVVCSFFFGRQVSRETGLFVARFLVALIVTLVAVFVVLGMVFAGYSDAVLTMAVVGGLLAVLWVSRRFLRFIRAYWNDIKDETARTQP